jgi:hypothetical protein
MGWFDALFGRRAPQVQDPEELWRLLVAAAQAGDDQQLQRLCRANEVKASGRGRQPGEGTTAHFVLDSDLREG